MDLLPSMLRWTIVTLGILAFVAAVVVAVHHQRIRRSSTEEDLSRLWWAFIGLVALGTGAIGGFLLGPN